MKRLIYIGVFTISNELLSIRQLQQTKTIWSWWSTQDEFTSSINNVRQFWLRRKINMSVYLGIRFEWILLEIWTWSVISSFIFTSFSLMFLFSLVLFLLISYIKMNVSIQIFFFSSDLNLLRIVRIHFHPMERHNDHDIINLNKTEAERTIRTRTVLSWNEFFNRNLFVFVTS